MSPNEYPAYGRHVLVDISQAQAEQLNDLSRLEQALVNAAHTEGVKVLDIVRKRFAPTGVTILLLLAESHVSLHTYPELGKAFFDAFTCGVSFHPVNIFRQFAANALSGQFTITEFERGWPESKKSDHD